MNFPSQVNITRLETRLQRIIDDAKTANEMRDAYIYLPEIIDQLECIADNFTVCVI